MSIRRMLLTVVVYILGNSASHATSFACPSKYDVGDAVINTLTFGQRDRQCDQQAAQRDAENALKQLQNAQAQITAQRANLISQLRATWVQYDESNQENERLLELNQAFSGMPTILTSLNDQFEGYQHYLHDLNDNVNEHRQLLSELNQSIEFLKDAPSNANQGDPYKNAVYYLWDSAYKRSQNYSITAAQYLGCVIAQEALKTENPANTFRETLQSLTLQINTVVNSGAMQQLLAMKAYNIKNLKQQIQQLDTQIITLDNPNGAGAPLGFTPVNDGEAPPGFVLCSDSDPLIGRIHCPLPSAKAQRVPIPGGMPHVDLDPSHAPQGVPHFPDHPVGPGIQSTPTGSNGPANQPIHFSINYTFQPSPGIRDWSLASPGTWEERYPDQTTILKHPEIGRTTVDGCTGALVSTEGGAPGAQTFIPDKGCKLMWARFRQGTGAWSFFGEMHDIRFASTGS